MNHHTILAGTASFMVLLLRSSSINYHVAGVAKQEEEFWENGMVQRGRRVEANMCGAYPYSKKCDMTKKTVLPAPAAMAWTTSGLRCLVSLFLI